MQGSIDRIYFRNNTYIIGGWAFDERNGSREIASLRLKNGKELNFERVQRGDCADDPLVGFEISASAHELYGYISRERIIIAKFTTDFIELPVWSELQNKCIAILVENLIKDADRRTINATLDRIIEKKAQSNYIDDQPPLQISVSPGCRSINESAVIGLEGQVFLFGGSNDVHSQYTNQADSGATESWINTIQNRAEFCRASNIEFIQLIIPEKQSVFPELYPFDVTKQTSTMKNLYARLESTGFYLDPTEAFRQAAANQHPPFRKIDSHLSINGVSILVSLLMERLGHQITINKTEIKREILKGDLGEKFFCNGGLREVCDIPLPKYIAESSASPIETKAVDVEGHIGTERSWSNPTAFFDQSVVVFGNSFFERGKDPLGLSYWFARLFKETHFYWTPDFDPTAVQRHRPDVVVCQTIERFIKYVPQY